MAVPSLKRFMGKVRFSDLSDCWIWTASLNHAGYGKCRIHPGGWDRAHRVSWRLFRGQIPNDTCVLHRCDNRSCVNPNHLFLGDRADNYWDMAAKGRRKIKLSPNEVIAIRKDVRTAKEIAIEYGVSISNVYHIRERTRWSSVK